MTNDNDCERLREEYLRKEEQHTINEKERLNRIFSVLGSTDTMEYFCNFSRYEVSTLDVVRTKVEAGDRKAMMALLVIMADSLHTFEVMPLEVRVTLADGLQKMRLNLEESRGFCLEGVGKGQKVKF